MTREELVKQKAQEVTSSGEFSPSLTECFIAGAEWEHKRLVKKACEWLKNVLHIRIEEFEDYDFDCVTSNHDSVEEFIDNFMKAMEE